MEEPTSRPEDVLSTDKFSGDGEDAMGVRGTTSAVKGEEDGESGGALPGDTLA